MEAIFAPTVLDWLFGAGIGTNLGAAFVWIPIGAVLGVAWSKTRYWPLHAIHARFEALEASHQRLHASHQELHRKLDALTGTPASDATPPGRDTRAG